jgi:hypothetical protein
MARLILEEGGARRAFKVGEGRLTIGSGQACALRLSSPGVAEVHAELEISGGFAFLRPRPGVMPPRMHGQPVTHQTPLADDVHFEIGAARFHYLAADTGAPGAVTAPRAAAAPVQPATPGIGNVRAGGAQAAGTKVGGARPATPRPALTDEGAGAAGVQRTRPRVKIQRGIPTWLLLVLIGAALIIAFFVVRGMLGTTGQISVIPEATLERARSRFESREFDAARAALALIPRDKVSDNLRRQIEALEEQMDSIDRKLEVDREHKREADDYRSTQLERFMKDRLTGDDPPRERVRVFLKRLREFRQRWPEYPDMDWVDRHERLYSRLVDLSTPPTLVDVAYEAETLTWAKPRDYRQATGLVRAFAERASGSDRQAALKLLDDLAASELAFFDDQMQQAKWHWERKESGKCVGVLISLVLGLDDPGRVDQAAKEFVQLPGFEEFLRGYRSHNPRRYADLLQNSRVKEAARKSGLL